MEQREELHHHGCSIAKQTILTTHPSGLQTRVSVELANFDALCLHSECSTPKKRWDSPFLARRILGSAHGTPVLGRRSDAVNEGRLSQQCTPVMRRRELESPGGSPLPARRGEECDVIDDNSVISGWLKFRDNKRWKSRWGVVTKLSPAADIWIEDWAEDTLYFLRTMSCSGYLVVKFSEVPYYGIEEYVCVPQSWKVYIFSDRDSNNNESGFVYPEEEPSRTQERIKNNEEYNSSDKWKTYKGSVVVSVDSYDAALKAIEDLKNSPSNVPDAVGNSIDSDDATTSELSGDIQSTHISSSQTTLYNEKEGSDNKLRPVDTVSPFQRPLKNKYKLPENFDPTDLSQQLKYVAPAPGLVELLPKTGVYINEVDLNKSRKKKSYSSCVRALERAIFTVEALENCSKVGEDAVAFDRRGHETRPGLDQTAIKAIYDFVNKLADDNKFNEQPETEKRKTTFDTAINNELHDSREELRKSQRKQYNTLEKYGFTRTSL